MEQRGIADLQSIENIANEGIGYMKGYKNKLKGEEDTTCSMDNQAIEERLE